MKAANLVPKLLGEDLELAGAIIGGPGDSFTGDEATRRVLDQVGGFPFAEDDEKSSVAYFNRYDSQRNYLPNGGCLYQDCGHVECCTAEVRSARDHVGAHHAMLRLAQAAAARANARLPAGRRIELGARNSDGFGNSFAAHLSLLLSREAWRCATSQLDAMSWWASALVSMPIYTGQGKVGSERSAGTPPGGYQLSSRAEFFESFVGFQTTERRPLINVRDEALCGERDETFARLHVIFFDSNLCNHAHWLKCGVLQILGAMLEAQCWKHTQVLADPEAAAVAWSGDPTLRTRARTAHRRSLTALEHQRLICESAAKFVGTGACEGVVPEADAIIAAWSETLMRLGQGDTPWLARRLDWVLKKQLLEGALAEGAWDSPEGKMLDHRYGVLGEGGLYFACEKAGLTEQLTPPDVTALFATQPPADTRAWTRGRLLELALDRPEAVHAVNWDHIVFQFDGDESRWRVTLDDPLGCTAATSPIREATTLAQALTALAGAGLLKEEPRRRHFSYAY